jgi:choline dehydrogenase-like flavoprotein
VNATIRRALTVVIVLIVSAATTAGQVDERTDANARDVLQQYATALASLDAEAVKKVQPSIDVESLRRALRDMKTLEVVIDSIKVLSSDASAARVSCRVNQTLTPKAGSKRSTVVMRVVRLRRVNNTWVIDSFER